MKKKLVVFTHNDLDGVSCALLGKIMSESVSEPFDEYEYYICNYDNIDHKVNKYFNEKLDTDNYRYRIYITDLSVNKETADMLDEFRKNDPEIKVYFRLYDHHKTAKWLMREYGWATVTTDLQVGVDAGFYPYPNKRLTCGTELFFLNEVMSRVDNCDVKANLVDYVELVRSYDTWSWKRENNLEAKKLNTFFSNLEGKDAFINNFYNKIVSDKENFKLFTDKENLFLDQKQREIEEFISDREKEMCIVTNEEYGFKFARIIIEMTMNVSELGNYIADKYIDSVDFVAIICNDINKISLRASDENEFDVSKVAERFGGGGHKKAAGCSLTEESSKFFLGI